MSRSRHSGNSSRQTARTAVLWLCAFVLAAGALYTANWLLNRERIRRESEQYSNLYTAVIESPVPTEAPTPTAAPTGTPMPSATSTGASMPEVEDLLLLTPTSVPETPATDEDQPEVVDIPIPTPDADTVVYALETPPPVQESFSELLALNPETVGFLKIGNIVSLPVVQRQNDNEYYLNHTFSGDQSNEGTLFLDGFNQLVPADDCLIIYGHNMNNGTMFGNLRSYLNKDFFRDSGVVSFDTIYENKSFVPFAAFNASMKPGDSNYVDIRRYLFSESEFDGFVSLLRAYSEHGVPVDVRYGDQLLLLVTCDYSNDDGRFILALRSLRENETAASVRNLISQAK